MVLPEQEHTIFLFWNKPADRAMMPHAYLMKQMIEISNHFLIISGRIIFLPRERQQIGQIQPKRLSYTESYIKCFRYIDCIVKLH